MPVAMSCSFSPAVSRIARIGHISRPKSARLPVTKQISRGVSVIAGLNAGAARKIDQPALDRFGNAEIATRARGEHGKPVHQRPSRTGAETGSVERSQQLVARGGVRLVEQD